MNALETVAGFMGGYIVPFILVLSLLVFVHEMGHYLAGRWSGIRILAFSIGFGPELLGWTDSHGTRWKISIIPLGGYVRFYGDDDASSRPDFEALEKLSDEERSKTFNGAKLWKRAITVAAGPIANFLLAIAIFAVIFSIYGKPVSDPIVSQVKPGSAAEQAGFQAGDRIVSVDGSPVATFSDLQRYVSMRPGLRIDAKVERQGKMLDLFVTPVSTEIDDNFGNKIQVGIIGIMSNAQTGNFRVERLNPVQAVGEGALQSWHVVTGTYDYISNMIAGRMKADQLGGPIRIAQASGEMASVGIGALLQLAAVLSVSIGLLNLMPVPVLDGGHLLFYAIEAVRGRPVGPAAQEIAFRIGLAMVLSLMVFATWNDIARLIS
ncbi:RIP metalloprotease RseP [Rhizobium sp. C1]|uniref:RIP metalloprotease RseP n=1 Tax=Rhizobium sp. C1 TaxID=1349799 RepID=UPI001E4BEDAD|nr:RIP metalloprotease RseP [Rhizobium sp. C1]MCD2177078.1 RIP metalloprotease RseP [Rhizobium sp. C1]